MLNISSINEGESIMAEPHLYQYDPTSELTLLQLLIKVANSSVPATTKLAHAADDETAELISATEKIMTNDDIQVYYQGDRTVDDRAEKINQTILLRAITQYLRQGTSAEGETTLRHIWLFNCNLHRILRAANHDNQDNYDHNFMIVWDDLSQSGMYLDCPELFNYHMTSNLIYASDVDGLFESNTNQSVIILHSPKDADDLIRQKLQAILDTSLSAQALRSLQTTFEFWSLQLEQMKLKGSDTSVTTKLTELGSDSQEAQFISFMTTALRTLSKNSAVSTSPSPSKKKRLLRFCDIINFYNEVQIGQLTDKSLPMLTQLTQSANFDGDDTDHERYSIDDVLTLYQHHKNYHRIISQLTSVTSNDLNWLTNEFKKDSWYRTSGYHISSVIKFDLPETRNLLKYPDHFIGIHGTTDQSVPSIALNGLMNSDELQAFSKKSNGSKRKLVRYETSGTALGVGIYFGRMDQISKPLLYANGRARDEAYLIIADVAYNRQTMEKVKWTQWTGEHNKEASLVWATRTGVRGKDEIVAPITKNIRIKYMLKLKKDGE